MSLKYLQKYLSNVGRHGTLWCMVRVVGGVAEISQSVVLNMEAWTANKS